MKLIYRKMKLWLMQTKVYHWALKSVIPYIRFTTYYTSFKGKVYHQGYDVLEPGDVILTIDDKKLTSMLIPGLWAHAAFCVSKDKKWEISEMTHTDYTKSTFFDICKESTRVCILRMTKSNPKYRDDMIRKCKSFVGVPYDDYFKLGIKALSCAELIYESDTSRLIGANLEDVAGLGQLYISPDGLYNAENLDVVWDSRPIL